MRFIAVDNASPDGSAGLLKRLLPDIELISSESNLGFAGGCNLAWPEVKTRYWMLLNPDVEAGATGLERLVGWMDRHPDVGLASPRLRGLDGKEMRVAQAHDSLMRPLVRALRLHRLLPRQLRARWLLPGEDGPEEVFDGWVPGAALIARSAAVAEVGPLDKSLFMYGEDREWCWRMAKSGWTIGVCQDVELIHGHGISAKSTWGEEERMRREVAGQLGAARRMHGRVWASALALFAGIVLLAESLDPRNGKLRVVRRMRGRLYLCWGLAWVGAPERSKMRDGVQ